MSHINKKEKPTIRLSINTKLLFVFLMLSIVLLAISAYISFNTTANLGKLALEKHETLREYAVDTSREALQDLAEAYLVKIAKDQAVISNIFFENIENATHFIAEVATDLWNDPSQFQNYERSHSIDETAPGDITMVSSYILAPNVSLDDVREEVTFSAILDSPFRSVLAQESEVALIYVGSESGVFRILPQSKLPATYDHRKRPWYQRAVKTEKFGWSEPYVDAATGDLIVSCSKPFHDSKGSLVGVVGIDVTLTTLTKKIINPHTEESLVVILLNTEGTVIARPGLFARGTKWDEPFETENLLQSENPGLRAVAESMTRGETGFERVKFLLGREKYIAYAPLPRTGWSLAVIIGEEKIIGPAEVIRKQINAEAEKTAEEIAGEKAKLRSFMGTLFVVMIFVVVGMAYALSKRITRPILALHRGVNTVGDGNLEYKIRVKSRDELEDLAHAFNTMTDDLKTYIHDLEKTTAAKEKFETEFQIGRDIQASLLPETLPEISGWEIEACIYPARLIGGDFYDVFSLEENKTFFVIADVCDKGVGPAMFAAIIRTLLRAFSPNYSCENVSSDSNELPLILTNEFIVENQTQTSMFATIFAGVLDPAANTIKYINGGHNPPYVLGADGAVKMNPKPTGPVLGAFPGVKYEIQEITLESGDTLFMFTDGVTEARDPNGDFFTDERLIQLLQQPAPSAAELLDRVVKNVQAHIADADQFDDITMLVIRRKSE